MTTTNIELLYAPARSDNPFQIAKLNLIASLARLPVPTLSVTPDPEQFEDVSDFIRSIASYGDVCMRAIGKEVKSNATVNIDLNAFESPFTDAVDGNATFECARAGDAFREDAVEFERAVERVRRFMAEG